MTREAFEQIVAEAFDAVPKKFKPLVKNVVVTVEDEPSDELRKEEGLGPGEALFGYYYGIPHTERGVEYGIGETYPDVITVFQKPIEAMTDGDPARIKEEVRNTIWHEFAHHFGLDEIDIEVREQKRR